MQINESRRNNESAGMNHTPSTQGLVRNAGNLTVADADVAHGRIRFSSTVA
jgi:hypothetical protein